MRLVLTCVLLTLAAISTGCASRDPRDAPWDPKPGRALHEQLPNWDHPMGKQPCYNPNGCRK
jgi:hypothetical protein